MLLYFIIYMYTAMEYWQMLICLFAEDSGNGTNRPRLKEPNVEYKFMQSLSEFDCSQQARIVSRMIRSSKAEKGYLVKADKTSFQLSFVITRI